MNMNSPLTSITALQVLETLRVFMRDHAEKYSLVRIGVFGSVARGEATPSSDIDIVYETSNPNLFLVSEMKIELEALLERNIDLVRIQSNMGPLLSERIEREAMYA